MYLDELYDSKPGDVIAYDGRRYKVIARMCGWFKSRLLVKRGKGILWCDIIRNGRPYWAIVKDIGSMEAGNE